ncbi:phosphoglycerate kinase [Candidatus Wirthbacteria bacterium CG2_30_54_11]|uniref:Phosphoglycerate kinase n=1 Tax=Candidatus Wirthbacteria bacterium CG2_30_54_11 TaxID=1817892 RepID=A0A1J5ILC3_9BACT|nr:MAG: phosphoglycerate kinase [Candidatus Wirthbacteria bacterium CG2_30_54_11]
MPYLTLDQVDVKGKRVLVRSDLDSPFDKAAKQIMDNERLSEAAKTLRELSQKGARVVSFGHQARPGKGSFTRMRRHAELLSDYIGKPVTYIDSIHDTRATQAIKGMKDGEILLLENVRFSSEETLELEIDKYPTTHMVKDLQPLFDIFVQDSFTTAHRAHTSMIGFQRIPNVAGRRFALEVEGIGKAAKHAERPYVMILGGAKIFDYFSLMDKVLAEGSVDSILVGGLFVDLCLVAKGYDLGKKMEFLKETDSLAQKRLLDVVPQVKEYLEKYPKVFVMPEDIAIEVDGKRQEIGIDQLPTEHMIYDIGSRTAAKYAQVIAAAKTIYLKGPVGMYENPEFALGSKIVIEAIASSAGYSLIGGGDSVTVAKMFAPLDKFSHVGLAGGATLKMLAGKKLIALDMLEKSYVASKLQLENP